MDMDKALHDQDIKDIWRSNTFHILISIGQKRAKSRPRIFARVYMMVNWGVEYNANWSVGTGGEEGEGSSVILRL